MTNTIINERLIMKLYLEVISEKPEAGKLLEMHGALEALKTNVLLELLDLDESFRREPFKTKQVVERECFSLLEKSI
jgi:hypothetical protein